jgi:GT2 family glycosyltransferase
MPVSRSPRYCDKQPDARLRRHPILSVCIINWNCRDYLRACLTTLTSRCQGIRLEVIVVDNGSSDGAAHLVAAEFPRVKLVRNRTNVGFARANNQAAALARGRYLLFLNNDTEVPPGTLGRLVAFARAHPEASAIGPRLLEPTGAVQTSWRTRPTIGALLHRTLLFRWTTFLRGAYRNYRGREEDTDETRPVEVLMGAALLMRRRVFRALGGWDEGYTFGGEDIDLCQRASKLGTILYHPATPILHHGRVSSRQAIGYAHANTVVGITRYLRRSGVSWWALVGYKLAVTLDAPLVWLGLTIQSWWRRLTGQPERAEKSRLAARGVGHFLTRHLLAFWRV